MRAAWRRTDLPSRCRSAIRGRGPLLPHSYDPNGNIEQIDDAVHTASYDRDLGYDDLDRLSSATGHWGTGSYTYDGLGNIKTKTENGGTMTYVYDVLLNRLTDITGSNAMTFSYDAFGNVTGNGAQGFTYNRAGQLVTSTSPAIAYKYDGHNRRVQETEGSQTTFTMYSQSGRLLHKLAGGVTTDYIYAGDMLVAKQNSATGIHYLHTDLLGSPIKGKVGSTSYTEHYRPWGDKKDHPPQLADDVGYTGHQSDVATGLTYMQARYYDPVVGRFMAVDPVQFTADNPMSFNRYAYGNNNPYKYTDPSGEIAKAIVSLVKVAYKSIRHGKSPIKGAADEIAGAVDDATTLLDGQVTIDDALAAVDLVVGTEFNNKVANTGRLPKPPTGPGAVPRSERDPKRFFSPSEREAKRAVQDHQCGNGCGTEIDASNSVGHHIQRHADGGRTVSENHAEVCIPCHKELHGGD